MTQLMISEDFHSIQGEGLYAGTAMHFVRLAGCNVGKHPSLVEWEIAKDHDFPMLRTGKTAYVCHTYDGRPFWCDTDFQKGNPITIREIFDNTWEKHLCLTGGEPLLHADKFGELQKYAIDKGVLVHLETSGTIEDYIPNWWITCSPKVGFLPSMINRSDEIKLLIDIDFKLEEVPECIRAHPRVYIQPVNNELTINRDNLNLCLMVQYAMPNWKLSVQLHKCFNWR